MNISAIGSVSSGGPTQVGAASGLDGLRTQGASSIAGTNGHSNNTGLANTSMAQNMSTCDFIGLTQRAGSNSNSMENVQNMIMMVVALELLEKTMEITKELLDNLSS